MIRDVYTMDEHAWRARRFRQRRKLAVAKLIEYQTRATEGEISPEQLAKLTDQARKIWRASR